MTENNNWPPLDWRLPHGIFAAGGAFVPTQEKKKKDLGS